MILSPLTPHPATGPIWVGVRGVWKEGKKVDVYRIMHGRKEGKTEGRKDGRKVGVYRMCVGGRGMKL